MDGPRWIVPAGVESWTPGDHVAEPITISLTTGRSRGLEALSLTAGTRAHDMGTDLVHLVAKELPRRPPAPWAHDGDSLISDRGRSAEGTAGPQFSGTRWSSGAARALLLDRREGVAGRSRWVVLAVIQVQIAMGHFLTDGCEREGRDDPGCLPWWQARRPAPSGTRTSRQPSGCAAPAAASSRSRRAASAAFACPTEWTPCDAASTIVPCSAPRPLTMVDAGWRAP